MTVQRVTPIFTVDDLPSAVQEHRAVLGLELVMDLGWIAFLADSAGAQIGLMTQDASAPVNPQASVFVDDVEDAYRLAQEAGLEIVHPLTVEAWGVRRFFYRDSSGTVVNVGMHL
ncbi:MULTISPECIES: VOC family protein [Actinomycetes]